MMNKWVYEPQCCDGECNQGRSCHKDAAIRAQREEADESYIDHRWSDFKVIAAIVLVAGAFVIGLWLPLVPAWVRG
jgi:hypothetical protein